MSLTPEEYHLLAVVRANKRWSRMTKPERQAATLVARTAQMKQYLDAQPADLPEDERARRALAARKADLAAYALTARIALRKQRELVGETAKGDAA